MCGRGKTGVYDGKCGGGAGEKWVHNLDRYETEVSRRGRGDKRETEIMIRGRARIGIVAGGIFPFILFS